MMMLHRMMEEGEDRGHGIDGHGRFHWIVCGAVASETECGSVEFGVGISNDESKS